MQSKEVWVDHDGYVLNRRAISLVLTFTVTADDQVKAYIKKIMGQLKEWMYGGKISKLVVVITSKETGEHVERWQFDVRCVELHGFLVSNSAQVQIYGKNTKAKSSGKTADQENSVPE
jgi:mitotic spindle assembly checkpoint protein MAD2